MFLYGGSIPFLKSGGEIWVLNSKYGKTPQIIHFNRVFPYKPSILGYHYFWKHPYTGILTACMLHSSCRNMAVSYGLWRDSFFTDLIIWSKSRVSQAAIEIDFVSLRLTLYPYCLTGLSDNFTPPITVIYGISLYLFSYRIRKISMGNVGRVYCR